MTRVLIGKSLVLKGSTPKNRWWFIYTRFRNYSNLPGLVHTLPETNSEFTPENCWQRGTIRLPFGPIFGGRTVSFREGSPNRLTDTSKNPKEFHSLNPDSNTINHHRWLFANETCQDSPPEKQNCSFDPMKTTTNIKGEINKPSCKHHEVSCISMEPH